MVSYLYTIQTSTRGHNSLQYEVAERLMATMGHELSMAVADSYMTSPQRNNGVYYIAFYHEGHRTLFTMILDSLRVQYRLRERVPPVASRIPPEAEEGIPAPFSKKSEMALKMHNWGHELLKIARGGL